MESKGPVFFSWPAYLHRSGSLDDWTPKFDGHESNQEEMGEMGVAIAIDPFQVL